METAAGIAAGRGSSLPMPSSRKEWRAVLEHSVRNAGNEELEHSKLGQSNERTTYEVQQGTEQLEVDFCSITMDNDILQQRLHSVARQREELQQMEIELRAQLITRSEIMEMQHTVDAQIKEHVNAAVKLQEQLQERDQTIHELERKMEDKDRELRAIKIDNEAAWAKEDLLREQNKELATFRRERGNSEAERGHHLKQIHDLKEHIQEKERQFLELEEQHRDAQETNSYKDEQLREAQAWVARVQEMDALQSTTNHSLQAELRERTEQFNQFWLGCHRQFADLERLHLHTIQQLQLELAEARERSGTYSDEPHITLANSKDVSPFGQSEGNQLDVNDGGTLDGNSGVLPNGNVYNVPPSVSTGNASIKTDHIPGAPVVPSSLLGMSAYLPPGQVTTLHPFVMHQGVPHSIPSASSNVPQPHVGHFQQIPAIPSHLHWQNQQAVSEGSHISNHNQYQPSQTENDFLRSGAHYGYKLSVNGQALHTDYMDAHISRGQEPGSVITTSSEEAQVLESNNKMYSIAQQPHQNLQEISSQFHEALRLNPPEQNSETKGQDDNRATLTNHSQEDQGLTAEQPNSVANTSSSDTPTNLVNFSETIDSNANGVVLSEASFSAARESILLTLGKIPEPTLLDERSLLACIVRATPAGSGGRIRISSTLPNRLSKMLAPLHWHDYKKKYGKLDDFVAGHPELFVIEGDFIQLREGAQEIIAATAAVAKVAAAASAPYSSLLPSVSVTPVAQTHRLKKVPFIDSKPVKAVFTEHAIATMTACDKPSQISAMQNQYSNGVCYDIVQGLSNIKMLMKPKDPQELNSLQSETRPAHASVHMTVGNGANTDRIGLDNFQNKRSTNGRHGTNSGGKPQ